MGRKIPEITYKEVIDILRAYIKNNCANVGAKWGTLANCYKSGSYQLAFVQSNKNTGCATHNITKTSNIREITEATVDKEIDDFFIGLGILPAHWERLVDDTNLFKLLYNIALFSNTKICYACAHAVDAMGTITNTSVSKTTSISRRVIVYSHEPISGGKTMFTYPNDTEDEEIKVGNITIGNNLNYTLSMPEFQDIVNAILENRNTRKVIPVTYTASITVA